MLHCCSMSPQSILCTPTSCKGGKSRLPVKRAGDRRKVWAHACVMVSSLSLSRGCRGSKAVAEYVGRGQISGHMYTRGLFHGLRGGLHTRRPPEDQNDTTLPRMSKQKRDHWGGCTRYRAWSWPYDHRPGGGALDIVHGRSRMPIDPCIPSMPGRSTRRIFTDHADIALHQAWNET